MKFKYFSSTKLNIFQYLFGGVRELASSYREDNFMILPIHLSCNSTSFNCYSYFIIITIITHLAHSQNILYNDNRPQSCLLSCYPPCYLTFHYCCYCQNEIPVCFSNSSTFQYTFKIPVHFKYILKFQYTAGTLAIVIRNTCIYLYKLHLVHTINIFENVLNLFNF